MTMGTCDHCNEPGEALKSMHNIERYLIEAQDMDFRTQIGKYFNVPWTEIEIIKTPGEMLRFKLDKQLIFTASISKTGKVKDIRAD
jgi:hypothetical protein